MMGPKITKEELERRRGINVGFFYLREKGATSAHKVAVFVKGVERLVWDGKSWRQYAAYEPESVLEDAIARCQEFNGACQ